MKKPANTRVRLYFREIMGRDKADEERTERYHKRNNVDYVDDLIESHMRQRYIIDIDNRRQEQYEKIPRFIRKVFGCLI